MSDSTMGDNEGIEQLDEQAVAILGEGRIETMAYDKAADDAKVHATLHEHHIKPVIQVRQLWQEEKEKTLRVGLPVVYDEPGTVFCYATVSEPPGNHHTPGIGHAKALGTVNARLPPH